MAKRNTSPSGNRQVKHVYEHLAGIVEYPREDIREPLAACIAVVRASYPSALPFLELFRHFAQSASLEKLQEVYTTTFDLKPFCTLDIGYHVFGESYKRGAFLVGMRGMVREAGLEPITELPDHLPVVLRLLVRIPQDDEYQPLVTLMLAPALTRMLKEFEKSDNVYGDVIRCIDAIIRQDHTIPPPDTQADDSDVPPHSRDFIGCDSKYVQCSSSVGVPAGTMSPVGCPFLGKS